MICILIATNAITTFLGQFPLEAHFSRVQRQFTAIMPSQRSQTPRITVPSRKIRENHETARSTMSRGNKTRKYRTPTPAVESGTQSEEDKSDHESDVSMPPKIDKRLFGNKYILSAATFVDSERVFLESTMPKLGMWNCQKYEDNALPEVQRLQSKYEDCTPEKTSCIAVVSGHGFRQIELDVREPRDYWKVEELLFELFKDKVKRVRVDYKSMWTLNLPTSAGRGSAGQGTSTEAQRTTKKRRVILFIAVANIRQPRKSWRRKLEFG
jgi:hypothetical protein